MLKVSKTTIQFGGLKAVDNVDFLVKNGTIFGLIGPNGAGKTTLFNIISGVYSPSSGKILFKDEVITGLPPYKICNKGIARTYQNINIFEKLTVLENVMIGCHTKIESGLIRNIFRTPQQQKEEKIMRDKCLLHLKFLGLEDKKDVLSKNLSYGDQRRLEIARALASEPELLLLDEPAAGMNSKEKLELAKIINKINELKITIMIVEHDMKLVMNITNDICVLNFGKKIAQGTPLEVQNDPKVIEAYLGGGLNES